jgi:hypothetical protein
MIFRLEEAVAAAQASGARDGFRRPSWPASEGIWQGNGAPPPLPPPLPRAAHAVVGRGGARDDHLRSGLRVEPSAAALGRGLSGTCGPRTPTVGPGLAGENVYIGPPPAEVSLSGFLRA